MVHNLTYSASIFNTLGVLSSVSFTETIWSKYEKYAVKTLKKSTYKFKELLSSVDKLSINELIKQFEILDQLMPVLNKQRENIEPINDTHFRNFKNAAIEFFNIVDLLFDTVHTEIHKHPYNDETLAALEEDTSGLKRYTSIDDLVNDLRN